MFELGEKVIYKKDLCTIKEIKKNHYHGKDYYVLESFKDPSLKIDIPTENLGGYLRKVMTKEEAECFISQIPGIDPIEVDDRNLGYEYQALLNTNNSGDLIRIIKTTYLKAREREKKNKKPSDRNQEYLEKAQNYLYNELSVSLNISYEECRDYVLSRIEKQTVE